MLQSGERSERTSAEEKVKANEGQRTQEKCQHRSEMRQEAKRKDLGKK